MFSSVEVRLHNNLLLMVAPMMGTPPAIKMYVDVEHLLMLSPARSESVLKPSTSSGTSFLKRIPRSVVLGDIVVDVLWPPCATSGVTA